MPYRISIILNFATNILSILDAEEKRGDAYDWLHIPTLQEQAPIGTQRARPTFYQTQPLKGNSENWDGRSDLSSQFGDVYDMPSENKYYIVKGRRLVVLRKRKQSNSYVVTGFKADDPNKVRDIRKEGKLLEKGE